MGDDIVTRLQRYERGDRSVYAVDVVSDALDEIERLRAELAEDETLRERMTEILHATANALHGGPLANGFHSWHDLPERAKLLRAEAEDRRG